MIKNILKKDWKKCVRWRFLGKTKLLEWTKLAPFFTEEVTFFLNDWKMFLIFAPIFGLKRKFWYLFIIFFLFCFCNTNIIGFPDYFQISKILWFFWNKSEKTKILELEKLSKLHIQKCDKTCIFLRIVCFYEYILI